MPCPTVPGPQVFPVGVDSPGDDLVKELERRERGTLTDLRAVAGEVEPTLPDDAVEARRDVHAARGVLEAALYAQGWATRWSRREPYDRALLSDFYSLDEHEEVLGWLFVGRAASRSVPARTINLPPRELGISYL